MEQLRSELWNRKWNVILKGISGDNDENVFDSERKVRDFMENTLKIDTTTVSECRFQAVHRLRGGPDGRKHIIARFVNLGMKDLVLQKAYSSLKGSGYAVTTDLPVQLQKLRNQLLKERRDLGADGKNYKVIQLREPPFIQMVEK